MLPPCPDGLMPRREECRASRAFATDCLFFRRIAISAAPLAACVFACQPSEYTEGTMQAQKSFRWQSAATYVDKPPLSIALGPDSANGDSCGHARGIIAIGDIASGVIAIGAYAEGIFAFGGIALGAIALGGLGYRRAR
jgi:hypothetical protein